MKNKIFNLIGLATRAGNVIAGSNACENALKMRKIKMLIISEEASEKTKKNYKFFQKKCLTSVFISFIVQHIKQRRFGKIYRDLIQGAFFVL